MDQDTHTKILETTVKLLFTLTPSELTTRRIAREAEVNIAAINYHFRSKEELVNKAMEAATAKAFEIGLKVLLAPGKDPAERLREFLSGYVKGLVGFAGLTRTAFLDLFRREDSGTFYGRYLQEMLSRIGQVIAEAQGTGAGPVAEPGSAATALMVVSCVVFPFLVSNTARDAGAVDYGDESARRRYIEATLARLVGAK